MEIGLLSNFDSFFGYFGDLMRSIDCNEVTVYMEAFGGAMSNFMEIVHVRFNSLDTNRLKDTKFSVKPKALNIRDCLGKISS